MSRILAPDQVRRPCWQIPPGRTDLGTVRTLGACVVRTRTHAYVHVHLTCNFLQEPASWLSTVLAALCRELARWPVGRRHPHTRRSRREPVVALPYRTDPPRSCWSSAYAADHIERGVAFRPAVGRRSVGFTRARDRATERRGRHVEPGSLAAALSPVRPRWQQSRRCARLPLEQWPVQRFASWATRWPDPRLPCPQALSASACRV